MGHQSAEISPKGLKYQAQEQTRPPNTTPVAVCELVCILCAAVTDMQSVSQVCDWFGLLIMAYTLYSCAHAGFDISEVI